MKKTVYYITLCLLMLLFSQCSTSKKSTEADAQGTNTHAVSAKGKSTDSLQGTWKFDYFTMVHTDKKILFPAQFPELTFDTRAKRFSGSSGCNSISGTYSVSGDNMTFNEPMIMTRMACNAMGEKSFIDYLKSVTRYTISGNTLQLITDLKPVIVMQRVQK